MKSTHIMVTVSYLILFGAAVFPASAEFYKYVDDNGVVRFTDDLSQVPADQRKEVPIYRSSQTPDVSPEAPAGDSAAGTVETPTEPEIGQGVSAGDIEGMEELEAARKRLEATRKQLNAEREALMRAQDKLKAENHRFTSKQKADAYQAKWDELKAQIGRYEEKMAAYEAEVERFNARSRELQEAVR